jgi:hypothetical protein
MKSCETFEIPSPGNDPEPTAQYMCACGSRLFTAYCGDVEISVACAECGSEYVIHEG